MGTRLRRAMVVLAAWLGTACGGNPVADAPRPLLVFAAASLREVAVELAAEHQRQTGVACEFNFAGSNVLAQQIAAAPLADVYLSADGRWVDHLEAAGRTVPGSRRPILSNRLVVVARRDAEIAIETPRDLAAASYRHLAVGDPEGVPAGRYAKAWLEAEPYAGTTLWAALAERLVPSLDVRAALALVESDPRVLGVVYRTDARSAPRVRVVLELAPRPELPEITYWAVAIAGGESPEGARRFLDFLTSPPAVAVAERHGFTLPVIDP